MVARINTGKNIANSLNYNEQKVHAERAELISASGFLQEPGSDLGKEYSAKGILERLELGERPVQNPGLKPLISSQSAGNCENSK